MTKVTKDVSSHDHLWQETSFLIAMSDKQMLFYVTAKAKNFEFWQRTSLKILW
jgi:hypothetical protein